VARRKKDNDKYTLVVDSPEGNAGTIEDIQEQAEPEKKPTLAQKQSLALARLGEDEKKQPPKMDEEKPPPPPIPLDVSWCKQYLADYELEAEIVSSGQVFVAKLIDVNTGNELVGHDLDHRPHTFGATKDRALLNAIEYHKRLPAVAERRMRGPDIDPSEFEQPEKPNGGIIENTTFGDWDTEKQQFVDAAKRKKTEVRTGYIPQQGTPMILNVEVPPSNTHVWQLVDALRAFIRIEMGTHGNNQIIEVKRALKDLYERLN
jgi:hypothetical protein